MATKSFLKTVHLRGAKQCQNFIKALESSQSKQIIPATTTRKASDMSKEQIQKIFGDSK